MTLRAFPGVEGPQIILGWDVPSGTYNQVILQRRADRYPNAYNDGDHIIATSSGTSHADISGLKANSFYYYSLFVQSGSSYRNDSGLKAFSPALETNFFKNFLYSKIAPKHRELDFLVSEKYKFNQQFSGSQYINIGETGNKEYPFYERYLRNIGLVYDRAYSLMKMANTMFGINTMPDPWIQHLRDLVKAPVYEFEDIETKRHKIRNAVIYHSKKGTITGINSLVRDVFQGNVESTIYEKFRNILYLARKKSTFLNQDTFQFPYFQASGTQSGTQSAFLQLGTDREISPDKFEINIDQDSLINFSQPTNVIFERLHKRLIEYIPATQDYYLKFKSNIVSCDFSGFQNGLIVSEQDIYGIDSSFYEE